MQTLEGVPVAAVESRLTDSRREERGMNGVVPETIPQGMEPVVVRLRAMQGSAQHPTNLYKCAADRCDELERQVERLLERVATLEGQLG
jgi:hypothetical protein